MGFIPFKSRIIQAWAIIMQVHVIKFSHGDCDTIYEFDLPDVSEPGFYRQGVSFNSFFHFSGRNKFKNTHYKAYMLDDHIWPRFSKRPTIIECENIWEFYKLINFDYKTKKYLD